MLIRLYVLINSCCLHLCVIDTRVVSTGSWTAHCVLVCTSSSLYSRSGGLSLTYIYIYIYIYILNIQLSKDAAAAVKSANDQTIVAQRFMLQLLAAENSENRKQSVAQSVRTNHIYTIITIIYIYIQTMNLIYV